jgi:hypothetical protein
MNLGQLEKIMDLREVCVGNESARLHWAKLFLWKMDPEFKEDRLCRRQR